MAENHDLRVLIVDDSVLYRRVLTEVVEGIPGAAVADTAAHGQLALAKLAQMPVDAVLCDVEMPVMDGLATLEAIRKQYPDTGVIMVSGVNRGAADITLKALAKGALDFVPKPEGSDQKENILALTQQLKPLFQLLQTRRALGRARKLTGVSGHPTQATAAFATPKPASLAAVSSRTAAAPGRIDVVAIGVSTGGPNALAEVIPKLPAHLGVPVLMVQHMPPVFTKSLADTLDKKSSLKVREATDGEPVNPNTVYIAQGGKHMVVRRRPEAAGGPPFAIGINENPPENSCRPAVDVLFRSIAANYGGNMLAVIMTGMGTDGREGVKAMKRQGCLCLSQSADTCVVYGMPMAVDEAGLSDERVPLAGLADRIAALVRNPLSK